MKRYRSVEKPVLVERPVFQVTPLNPKPFSFTCPCPPVPSSISDRAVCAASASARGWRLPPGHHAVFSTAHGEKDGLQLRKSNSCVRVGLQDFPVEIITVQEKPTKVQARALAQHEPSTHPQP